MNRGKKRYISKDSLRQLALASGVLTLSKNSFDILSDIYLVITWNILDHAQQITSNRNGVTLTKNDMIRGLTNFQQDILDDYTDPNPSCDVFKKKRTRFKNNENYKKSQVNFYKNLKQCSFIQDKTHTDFLEFVLSTIGFEYKLKPDTKELVKMATEKIFKNFMEGLGLYLKEKHKKVLKTDYINDIWVIFKQVKSLKELQIELDPQWYYKRTSKKESLIQEESDIDLNTVNVETKDEMENEQLTNEEAILDEDYLLENAANFFKSEIDKLLKETEGQLLKETEGQLQETDIFSVWDIDEMSLNLEEDLKKLN